MEYVPRARTIIDFADEKNLSLRERLKLFVKVCAAIENGHHNNIIHRDLKPGNILIDETGNPKIIDFGVARATEVDVAAQTMHTEEGRLVGTIQYMAPEQLETTRQDLDARCDVYALGAVLYKLVTGRQPHNLKGLPVFTAAQVIREDDPPRPSSIRPEVKGDLETIILKALEKDRTRRYRTAGSLGRDLVRFLADKPIQARKAGLIYRVRLFARRHRVELTAGAIVIFVMAIAASVVIYQRMTMPEPATVARGGGAVAPPAMHESAGEEPTVDSGPEPIPPGAGGETAVPPAQHPEPPDAFTLSGQTGRITALTFGPTGRFLASASEDLSVMVWDVAERQSVLTTADHDGPVAHIAFTSDGSLLATSADDGRIVLVDRVSGRIVSVLRHGFTSLKAVAIGPGAEIFALACDDLTVRTYRRDGAELHTHRGTTGAFRAVAFSPDGALLAGGSEHGGVYLWEVSSGRLIRRFAGLRDNILGLGFDAAGNQLIAITETGAGMAWTIETQEDQPGRAFAAGIGDLIAARFDPTGRWLACASEDQVMVWDIAAHQRVGRPIRIGDGGAICGLAVAPDGRWCATGRASGEITLTPIPERW
jgi:hypothetical protein